MLETNEKILVGLGRWREYFSSIKEKDAWNHAYIISGPRGIGKKELARHLIANILCLGDTDTKCISCRAWRRNESGEAWHPDLIILKPDQKTGAVTIESIRSFLQEVSGTPSVSKRRVALLSNMSLLNIQGFNALLKTLEEPPSHLTIIGIVEHIDLLPATVVSRVHHCAIAPTNYHDLTGYLALSFSRDESKKAADLSYGRPAWSEKILTDKGRLKEYNEETVRFINECLDNPARAFSKLDNILSSNSDKYKLAKLFDHWQLIVRDILLLKTGRKDRVGHSNFMSDLEKFSERGTILGWMNSLDALFKVAEAVQNNGQRRLQIGQFLLTLPNE
jgi:DNA polymerase-3 subunit delta'